jgi:hypothetical protein
MSDCSKLYSVVVSAALLGCARAFSSTSITTKASVVAAPVVKNVAVPSLTNGMDYVKLGDSDLLVSKVCCGTMTFGEQNTLEEGVEQLNLVFDEYGVNFLDTAEMYPGKKRPQWQL